MMTFWVLVVMLVATPSLAFALVAPASLTATALSSSTIQLTWSDPNTAERGTQIERSRPPTSGFLFLASVSRNVTAYLDTTGAPSTIYYYRVRR